MFKILTFHDYHCIINEDFMPGWKHHELGCFPEKNHYPWQYYGLFWKGRKPSRKKILASIKRKTGAGPYVCGYSDLPVEFKDLEIYWP